MTTAVASRSAPATASRVSPHLVTAGFAAFVVAAIAAHQGPALRWVFPLLAVAVAAQLYWRAGFPAYIAFAWAIWMVSPGLRRVVDYQAGGWDPENPISLAPFLVSGLAVASVVRRLPELRRRRFMPWIVILLAVCYGYFAGILEMGMLASTHALLTWAVPLLCGLAIALEWRVYPASAAGISRVFFWGGVVLAAYAVVQFINPPPWDRLWVASAGMQSVGQALPFQLRVFSLSNAPLALATLLGAALFLGMAQRGSWRVAGIAVIAVALLLTLVRSVWLATMAGALVYVARMPRRLAVRFACATICVAAAVIAIPTLLGSATSAPAVEAVTSRVATFADLHNDISYNQRASFMDQVSTVVLERPLGHGLGSTGVSSQLAQPDESGVRDFDSGIFAALYALGWFGGAALLGATIWMTLAGLTHLEGPGDMHAAAARAIMVGSVLLSIGGNVFDGVSAAVLWGFAGLLVAAQQWHHVHTPRSRRRA
ncbi:MAG TPA: O-antigen ligase family protein [Gemmatimonadales bacterium]|jgi:hypothetical protein